MGDTIIDGTRPSAVRTGSRSIRTLAIGSLVVFWCLVASWAFYAREQVLKSRQAVLIQTVSVVEEQAVQMFSLLRLSLLSADHWIVAHPQDVPGENKDFINLVNGLRESSGHRVDIRMVTRDGKLAYVPHRSDAANTDVSDREYFRVQLDENTRGFHIASPVLSRVTGKWGIPISIPSRSDSGRIGVLFGAIELDQLAQLQKPLINEPSGSVSLLRRDGIIMSRTPFVADYIGKSVANSSAWIDHLGGKKKGVFIDENAPTDGRRRMVAFSHLEDYPIIAVITDVVDEVLQPWRNAVAIVVSLAMIITLGFIAIISKLVHTVSVTELAWLKVASQAAELEAVNGKLKVLSVTDKLTQVFNRGKLDSVLVLELDRAVRYALSFAVILLDIDHFKLVNDTHGHNVGDLTLLRIAEVLRAAIRKTDIVGRWGGEEFLLILPETDATQAMEVAEKIRKSIFSKDFSPAEHLTASMGVTSYSKGDTARMLIARADEALYEAKNQGRNRVTFKSPE